MTEAEAEAEAEERYWRWVAEMAADNSKPYTGTAKMRGYDVRLRNHYRRILKLHQAGEPIPPSGGIPVRLPKKKKKRKAS